MNNTLTNGFKLLELLATSNSERSVTELAAEMERPASHICRLLKTLVATGYVEQNPATRKYWVSLRLLTLSHVRLASLDFRRIGHPFAVQLANELSAHTYLSQPLRGLSIVVDVAWPCGSNLDVGLVIGQIHSIRLTACGKLCAAYASAGERADLLAMMESQGQVFDRAAWLAELDLIRNKGLSVRQELGILALAAPVLSAGGDFCGALGLFCPPEVTTVTPELEAALRRAAGAISFALGYPLSQ